MKILLRAAIWEKWVICLWIGETVFCVSYNNADNQLLRPIILCFLLQLQHAEHSNHAGRMKCDEVQKFRTGIWVCFFNRTMGSMSLVTKTNTTCCNERHLLYSQQALKLTLLKVTFIFILRILFSSSFLCNFYIFFFFLCVHPFCYFKLKNKGNWKWREEKCW